MIRELFDVISSTAITDIELMMAQLPVVVGALIVLLVGAICGRAIGGGTKKLLNTIRVDRMVDKSVGCSVRERCGISVSGLSGKVVAWFVYVSFVVAAVDILDVPMFSALMHQTAVYIPHILAAVLVLVGGLVAMNFGMNTVASQLRIREIPHTSLIICVLRGLLTFVVVVLALEQLLLDMTIVYVILTPLMWGVAVAIVITVLTKVTDIDETDEKK